MLQHLHYSSSFVCACCRQKPFREVGHIFYSVDRLLFLVSFRSTYYYCCYYLGINTYLKVRKTTHWETLLSSPHLPRPTIIVLGMRRDTHTYTDTVEETKEKIKLEHRKYHFQFHLQFRNSVCVSVCIAQLTTNKQHDYYYYYSHKNVIDIYDGNV